MPEPSPPVPTDDPPVQPSDWTFETPEPSEDQPIIPPSMDPWPSMDPVPSFDPLPSFEPSPPIETPNDDPFVPVGDWGDMWGTG